MLLSLSLTCLLLLYFVRFRGVWDVLISYYTCRGLRDTTACSNRALSKDRPHSSSRQHFVIFCPQQQSSQKLYTTCTRTAFGLLLFFSRHASRCYWWCCSSCNDVVCCATLLLYRPDYDIVHHKELPVFFYFVRRLYTISCAVCILCF